MEHCSSIQSFDGVVPDTTVDAQPVTTVNEFIPIIHCTEALRDLRPEGQVCCSARNNSLASNSTQRCRSNEYCLCRRIFLCVENLPSVGSSSLLRPTPHQNNCFSEAAQTDTSGTINCCF
ncbi:hypothetical protein TNIN_325701 [Trichonephila inaurata madagascariensis]|uniref:Uncharacterized protein n=1 Tax=Trichonephila inaurata madagascariensis TaxID=2747483 RepID=A0A8X7CB38_9ARAC|nr:hypothetical protein TNIN_325701 [Trichonephila inaurata madagascariensis]